MKLISFQYADDLYNIDFNHRQYCETNNIKYKRVILQDEVSIKYATILAELQQNIGEELLFIDSYSYFNNFTRLNFENDIFVQKNGDHILDNFIFVRSNIKTINIFIQIYKDIKTKIFMQGLPNTTPEFPIEYIQKYPHENNGIYTNIDINYHENSFKVSNINILFINTDSKKQKGIYFAEAILGEKNNIDCSITEEFSITNPNQKNGLVMLYTHEIKNYAAISERNISEYCIKNSLTLYVHRTVPEGYENCKGNWCKAALLLKHIEQHENICWIDSDILLTNNFKFNFSKDVTVYHDPASWEFNSGFMHFKNTQKNKNLLIRIEESIKKIPDKSLIYIDNGDQGIFIKEIFNEYPDIAVQSNILANSYPTYPIQINPRKHDAMIHFMGYKNYLRERIMAGYAAIIREE